VFGRADADGGCGPHGGVVEVPEVCEGEDVGGVFVGAGVAALLVQVVGDGGGDGPIVSFCGGVSADDDDECGVVGDGVLPWVVGGGGEDTGWPGLVLWARIVNNGACLLRWRSVVSDEKRESAGGSGEGVREGGEGSGPAVAEKRSVKKAVRGSGPRVDKLPPYRVLLHNDDVNDMGFVVSQLVSLTPLAQDQALKVMFEAHAKGLALVTVTHKERAELMQEQLRSVGLCATIEPAG